MPILHQFDRGERFFPEFPDGKRGPPGRHFRSQGQLQAGPVREGRIDHRGAGGDVFAGPLGKGDGKRVEDIGFEGDVGLDIPVFPVVEEQGDLVPVAGDILEHGRPS